MGVDEEQGGEVSETRPGPAMVKPHLLGWACGGESGAYANEQESHPEAVIVIGSYL